VSHYEEPKFTHEKLWVALMWIAIAVFPVAVLHCPPVAHALFWLFAPFRDHLGSG
jgi:hypothetical protein